MTNSYGEGIASTENKIVDLIEEHEGPIYFKEELVSLIDRACALSILEGKRQQHEEVKKLITQHAWIAYISRDEMALSKADIVKYQKDKGSCEIGRRMLDEGFMRVGMDPDPENENLILRLKVWTIDPKALASLSPGEEGTRNKIE